MSGEKNLKTLLQTINPFLKDGEFVFCTVPIETVSQLKLMPIGQFLEDEGVTLILEKTAAQGAGLDFTSSFKLITLNVYSSLEAVGFIAVVATELARAGISVNPVSAYYHDHLFVSVSHADKAMEILTNLGSREQFC